MKIIRDFFNRRSMNVNPAYVKWMGMQCPNTPDIAELEESEFQLVFACDNLMRAGNNYKLIAEDSAFGYRGFTKHKFNFFSDGKDGAIPILGRRSSRLTPRQVKGEVHVVQTVGSPAFPKLDNHYRNGVQFRRIRVPIIIPYRNYEEVNNGLRDLTGKDLPPILQGHKFSVSDEQTCILKPWMYIGLSAYWNQHLDGGYNHPELPFFTSDKHPAIPSYYSFPKSTWQK